MGLILDLNAFSYLFPRSCVGTIGKIISRFQAKEDYIGYWLLVTRGWLLKNYFSKKQRRRNYDDY